MRKKNASDNKYTCFLCKAKFGDKERNWNGFAIKDGDVKKKVARVENDGKILMLCNYCVKAVTYGATIENPRMRISIVGLEPTYYEPEG